MELRSLVGSLLAVLFGLVCLSGSVAAQSANRDHIDTLEFQLLSVGVPLAAIVLLVLVVAVYRFRDEDDPVPTTTDPTLEISWTVAMVVVLLFVGLAGYSVLAGPYVSPGEAGLADRGAYGPGSVNGGLEGVPETDDRAVFVRAEQWNWTTSYPGTNATTTGTIVVPADENVTIWLTSEDVVHSLSVPDLGVKGDAIPGERTRIRTVAYEPGEYDARCAQFCGTGHDEMTATVVVLEPDAYDEWLEEAADAGNRSTVA